MVSKRRAHYLVGQGITSKLDIILCNYHFAQMSIILFKASTLHSSVIIIIITIIIYYLTLLLFVIIFKLHCLKYICNFLLPCQSSSSSQKSAKSGNKLCLHLKTVLYLHSPLGSQSSLIMWRACVIQILCLQILGRKNIFDTIALERIFAVKKIKSLHTIVEMGIHQQVISVRLCSMSVHFFLSFFLFYLSSLMLANVYWFYKFYTYL